jgi:hypothetical protein
MSAFLAIVVLVLASAGTLSAFGGKTWIEGTEPALKRITLRGWLSLVLLALGLIVGGIKELYTQHRDEKKDQDAANAATQAKQDAEHRQDELKTQLFNTQSLLLKARGQLDLQSQFSKEQASLASDRAKQQSEDLTQAREQLDTEQRRAADEIKQQQKANQTAISAQEELIEASLLGQQTASPRVALILPTTYAPSKQEKERWSNSFDDGGHVVALVLGEQLANLRSSPVANIDAEFASLEPRIANPIHDTVEYGWRVKLDVTKNLKSHVIASFGGPHDLIGRRPRFQLGYSTQENRVYLLLEASLSKPVSSALLFLGKPQGQQVASFSINVQDLDESTIHSAEEHMQNFFSEGEEWTLLNDSSAMCTIAKIAKPTVKDDGPSRQDRRPRIIEIAWHIDQTNRLALCPNRLFLADEAEEALDHFDPDEK